VVRVAIAGFCRLWFRLSIEGREHVPATGPFVLAPVHRSNIDFALASCLTRRRMGFIGKESLFEVPLLGPFISALGAYPVHRGTADREALRRTMAVIERGEPVVVFPEGTRQSGPAIENLFHGAAFLAGRAGIPVVPVGIGGSERAMPKGARFIRPARIHMVVGPPMTVPAASGGGRPPRRTVVEFTERLRGELQRLYDRALEVAGAVPADGSTGG